MSEEESSSYISTKEEEEDEDVDIEIDEDPCILNRQTARFSIDDILDPDFGIKKSPPCSPHRHILDNYRLSPPTSSSTTTTATPQHHAFSIYSLHLPHDRLVTSQPTPPVAPSKREVASKPTGQALWPAWVYCTRYSDRPSSGPRVRKVRRKQEKIDDKRPRTAFTSEQLASLKKEFDDNRYLTEDRRQRLAAELKLSESQVKIWFQNKRAKMKKSTGLRNPLAIQLMAQGLYNHSTVPLSGETNEDEDNT